MNIKIQVIDNKSSFLPVVRNLWRTNSSTLGFFPEGAFEDYAAKRHILVALDDSNKCIGYLLFRITVNRCIVIHHLCVDKEVRGQGVAHKLVTYLKEGNFYGIAGIRLSCRRDFPANNLWPKMGFIVLSNKPGKNYEGKEVTTWWLDFGLPTLFSQMAIYNKETKIRVVIDANIFFDITNTDGSEESKALLADWLQEYIELWITPELFNEINRNNNSEVRNINLQIAKNQFPHLSCKPADRERAENAIKNLYIEKTSESDESDLRQLSYTVASGCQFFITRDSNLIERVSSFLYDRYGITVINPAGLIGQFDELSREYDY